MRKLTFILVLSFITFSFTNDKNQLIKTKLSVTVLDQLGNRVKGAVVSLYRTKDDYLKRENPAAPSLATNKKGRVLFTGLDKSIYFVHAEKGDMDNVGSGIQTDSLVVYRINKISTIISDL